MNDLPSRDDVLAHFDVSLLRALSRRQKERLMRAYAEGELLTKEEAVRYAYEHAHLEILETAMFDPGEVKEVLAAALEVTDD